MSNIKPVSLQHSLQLEYQFIIATLDSVYWGVTRVHPANFFWGEGKIISYIHKSWRILVLDSEQDNQSTSITTDAQFLKIFSLVNKYLDICLDMKITTYKSVEVR